MKRLGMILAVVLAAVVMVSGVALAATFNGTSGPDKIKGSTGGDRINGKGGDDVLKGRAGDDRIIGGGGEDRVLAGSGDDFVKTWNDGRIPDFVDCGPGKDTIEVSPNRDKDLDTYKNCENRRFARR